MTAQAGLGKNSLRHKEKGAVRMCGTAPDFGSVSN
jgi:hypothetical protein